MKMNSENNETPEEKSIRIRIENEEKKQLIADEYGGVFGAVGSDSELPPEIESQFLDQMMAFENAFKSAKCISLYDFLEQPAFRKVEELIGAELTVELERLTKLMNRKMVSVDTICEVADSELYRFITEELFTHEINDMHIPGMMTHYTYEEFHPNHEYDIRNHSIDFFNSYLDKKSDYYSTFMTSEATKADWHMHFRQAFSSFEKAEFTINELEFDAEQAVVQFNCDFVGKVEGAAESLRFLGAGEMRLLFQWDFWCVDKLDLPKSSVC